jgi:NADH-quinone oxidoreductase subunit D
MRIGGVSQDVPGEFEPTMYKLLEQLPAAIDTFDKFLKENEVLLARSVGVGILPPETAINAGVTGPVLRASGVNWDLRKMDPYSIYDRFEFDVPLFNDGDIYSRFRIRMEEMRQSLRIIEQALRQFPEGPVKADIPKLLRPPAGDAYGHIEAPKGELGFYVVSDGSVAPYRCHIRPTSLLNLTALKEMVIGWKIADLVSIFGSIDICLGEVDR